MALAAALAFAAAGSANRPASAQYYIGSGDANVIVDVGVLEALGPAPAFAPAVGVNAPTGLTPVPFAPPYYVAPSTGPQGSPPALAGAVPLQSPRASTPALAAPEPAPPPAARPARSSPPAPSPPAPASRPPAVASAPAAIAPPRAEPAPAPAPIPPPVAALPAPVAPEPARPSLPPPPPAERATAPTPPPLPPPAATAAPARPMPPSPPTATPPAVASAPPAAASRPAPPPAARPGSATPSPTQRLAALPPLGDTALSLNFAAEDSLLTPDLEGRLAGLAQQVKTSDIRLQVKAYASGGGENASQARRTSLKRALTVRSYLIEQGIRSTRIDVRALGMPNDGGPDDRVDIVVLTP